MKHTLEEVKALVKRELEEANRNNPLFASDHEAIAVIWEEIEEAEHEYHGLRTNTEFAWNQIKHDASPTEAVDFMQKYAERLAAEAIQVAAMCLKRQVSLEEEEK